MSIVRIFYQHASIVVSTQPPGIDREFLLQKPG